MEEIYAVVFMDAIHYHVRNEGRIVKRAVYIAIGIDMEGHKDVLGMYVVAKRKREVLAFDSKRSEEPRRGRYPDRMCRRPDRLSPGN